MSLLRSKDIRNMRADDRRLKLKELDDELMHERGVAAMGGAPASPGKIKALRKNIARIITIEREMELAEMRPTEAPGREGEKKPATKSSRPPVEDADVEEKEAVSRNGQDKEEKK